MSTAQIANAALSRTAQRVLTRIDVTGLMTVGMIAQDLRLQIATVRKHASALLAAGLVHVRCVGGQIPTGHEVRDVQVFPGWATWNQDVLPTLAWQREGETDRKPGPNSYELVRNRV